MNWTRAILESPYAGEVEENKIYAQACLRDMFIKGEAGFASHLIYPSILQKYNNRDRELGMSAGKIWIPVANKVIVYTDLGVSAGMWEGIKEAERLKVPVEDRKLGWRKRTL